MATKKKTLEEKLIVGTKIKIGKKYAEYSSRFKEGDIITLIEGYFDEDNGLYCITVTAPSILDSDDKYGKEYSSIYHLFGNDLESFMDCEIIEKSCFNCKYFLFESGSREDCPYPEFACTKGVWDGITSLEERDSLTDEIDCDLFEEKDNA